MNLSTSVLVSLIILLLVQTLTIAFILVSLFLIKRYFNILGHKFDVKTMIMHCVLFVLNYTFLCADTVGIYFFVEATKQPEVNMESLLRQALWVNICQTMVQVTNTMSRSLIYYVYWKFALFCDSKRNFKEQERRLSVLSEVSTATRPS
jgi:hypothetical protein